MAESHSEDSPLLGSTDPPSPGECSPSHRGVIPSWSSSFHSNNEDASTSSWSETERRASSTERLHALLPREETNEEDRECEEEEDEEEEEEEEEVGELNGPKLVHSQTSMDSGCDCDPSETDGLPQVDTSGERDHRSGYSPLSSLPAEVSDSSSPAGPSGCVAPLAQKESLDCQCGALDQKCVCDTAHSAGASGTTTSLLHTDRGELPKVTFRIEGYEEEESYGQKLNYCCSSSNGIESSSQSGSEPGDDFRVLVKGATMMFPKITSYNKSGMLSASSSTASMPMCRICHFPQGEGPDTLISPCRCSGTMQFIHESCLKKWLDVSKSKKAASCELCNYQYNRHKKFRLRHWELPSCSRVDKILHSIFLLCLIIMATCATITIYCFKQNLNKVGSLSWLREDRFTKKREGTDLTKSEIVTLTCGVLFFVAFFMAMYVEVKAKDTLYRLFSRFLRLNQTWHIDEYDKQRDNQHAPV
ncbi:UNVERIFIED_CONTAM: hypothetical protein RMT77_010746 [Armadillidium vulgare]